MEKTERAAILEPNAGRSGGQEQHSDSEVAEKSGAGGGSRTRDLLITNQLLYH